MIAAYCAVMLDTGLWILDQKEFFFLFIQHQASSNQYRFASGNRLMIRSNSSVRGEASLNYLRRSISSTQSFFQEKYFQLASHPCPQYGRPVSSKY